MPMLAIWLLQISPNLMDIGKSQKVEIVVKADAFVDNGRGYKVTGDKATPDAMAKYGKLWAEEWSKYSPEVMAKARVHKIVFCENLSLNGQIRAAVPAFDLNTMYYDPALGAHSAPYQRNVVHHEFFHMIDQRLKLLSRDAEWGKLNPTGFRYENGGAKMRTPGVGNLTDSISGFLTLYGTSAIEEDKAELYSHLIVDPTFVTDLAKKDGVLAEKIVLLKKRLSDFDSHFGPKFWPKG